MSRKEAMNGEAGRLLSRSSPPAVWAVERMLHELAEQHSVLRPDATLKEIERAAILRALKSTDWNKQASARLLGVRRPTLYSKMRKHGIPLHPGESWESINSKAESPSKEREVATALRERLLNELALTNPLLGELKLASALWDALEQIGRFYRTEEGTPLFFRSSDRKFYEITDEPESDFGRVVTYLADVSVRHPVMRCSVDCIRARALEEAETIPGEEQVK